MAINLNVGGNTQPLEQAVQAAVNRIRRTPIKITIDDKGATQPLGNMKRGADEFSKSMEAANARIIAFGASMAIINGVGDAFKSMVRDLVQVEKALADINVVMGLSAANLDKFSSGLFRVAKETGAAFNVAAEAATEYARQGLTVEESLKRTRDALILTRLTGMDSAEAVKSLTAAMNTYGAQIKDTTQLVSKFAAVDVKFAVSAEDFADAIARTGQAAKSAGVDIDQLIGLVTAAQQQTARGGKVIGNSFKTIFTRIGRTDTLNQLENLGIAVRDLQGNTLGATRILTDLANTFDKLSAAQQAQIAQTVGGVFQINILKAVLSDAAKQNGILADATRISSSATDDAIRKNEQLRQTMSAVATETGLALKEVSARIGEIALGPGMEKILNTVKSLAEGLNTALGDGEEGGNKFAKGFLSGLGQVITGPGLVVMTAVFGKLMFRAFQYARDSLKSLIGVTSEAQKQKAIQTSLLSLFSRNTALNQEMLRTDISRTEKEKIILGLLQAQVREASALNAISKSAASTLYRQGFGPGLSPRRAGGHIPNFAHPERTQAAQGGYAAGNIRSMNMPGQGGVIYNSAETVKNFAGFKQPAIMPPRGSTAGKNYQKGFMGAHGFDPYAAGGYIPNYAKISTLEPTGTGSDRARRFGDMRMLIAAGREGRKGTFQKDFGSLSKDEANAALRRGRNPVSGATKIAKPINQQVLDVTEEFTMFVPSQKFDATSQIMELKGNKFKYMGLEGTAGEKVYGMGVDQLPKVKFNILGINPDVFADKGKRFGRGGKGMESMLSSNGYANLGRDFGNSLNIGKVPMIKSADITAAVTGGGGSGAKGALSALAGAIFEAAINSRFGPKGMKPSGRQGFLDSREAGVLGDLEGAAIGGDFDVEAGDLGVLKQLFGNQATQRGDYKISATPGNRNSFVKKVLQRKMFQLGKGSLVRPRTKSGKPGAITFTGSGQDLLPKAGGFIPNFADPLSDAIGRERGAGVPVSQIRVGAHSALRNRGNPMGLGVTNTVDEPNGLRDVFGANGFVPNYFDPRVLLARMRGTSLGGLNPTVSTGGRGIGGKGAMVDAEFKKMVADLMSLRKKLKKGEIDITEFGTQVDKTTKSFNLTDAASRRVRKRMDAMASGQTGVMGGLRRAGSGLSGLNRRFGNTAVGRSLSGMGGMGLMVGGSMLGGALQQGGPGSSGYALGGGLSGVGMGASIGMMFGPLGIAAGAAIGGLVGVMNAANESAEAIRKEKEERMLKTRAESIAAGAATGGGLAQALLASRIDPSGIAKRIGIEKGGLSVLRAANVGGNLKDLDLNPASPDALVASRLSKVNQGFGMMDSEIVEMFRQFGGVQINKENQPSGPIIQRTASGGVFQKEGSVDYQAIADEFKRQGLSGDITNPAFLSRQVRGFDLFQIQNKDGTRQGIYSPDPANDPRIPRQEGNDMLDLMNDPNAPFNKLDQIRAAEGSFFTGQSAGPAQAIRKAYFRGLATQGRKEALQQMLSGLGQRQVRANALTSGSPDVSGNVVGVGNEGIFRASQLLQQIQEAEAEANTPAKVKTFNAMLAALFDSVEKNVRLASDPELVQGVILQLNFQKRLAKAQAEAVDRQIDINQNYAEQNSVLNMQTRLLGPAMTEQQKATNRLNLALNKAAEAYEVAENTANKELTEGLFGLFGQKGDQPVALAVKQVLAKAANEIKPEDIARGVLSPMISADQISLTESLPTSASGILEILKEVQKEGNLDEGSKLQVDTLIQRFEDMAAANKKRKEGSEGIAKAEDKVNQLLGKQAQIRKDIAAQNQIEDMRVRSQQEARARARNISGLKRQLSLGAGFVGAEAGLTARTAGRREVLNDAILKAGEDRDKALRDIDQKYGAFMDRQTSILGYEDDVRMGLKPRIDSDTYKKLMEGEDEIAKKLKDRRDELDIINNRHDDIVKKLNQELQIQNALDEARTRHRTGPGAGARGRADAMGEIKRSVDEFDYNLNRTVITSFRDGMVGAMKAAIQEGEGLKGALLGAANSFLTAMQNALFENVANQLMVKMFPSSLRFLGGGGGVRNYSRGGGVPAMISNGEYVMGRRAVNMYGGGFMHNLNARGKIPGYSNGGPQVGSALAASPPGLTDTGNLYQKRAMSGFFYSGDNQLLKEDADATKARLEAERRAREAKRAKRQAFMKNLIGTAVGFGLSYMMSGGGLTDAAKEAGYGKDTPRGTRMGTDASGLPVSLHPDADPGGFMSTPVFRGRSFGGPIRRYAPGGFVNGKSGIDQIPAMLSEGEYVIKSSSVRQLGTPLLDRINAGKFNEGGPTTPIMEQSESAMGTGGNTNNINISVNVGGGSEGKGKGDDQSVDNPADASQENDGNVELAKKIKSQVVQVIREEQRPGGLLGK